MGNVSRHMIYSLGGSKSFGRLSLEAKVLWPMLIAAADDQGRIDAESDAVKYQVCQNVKEIAEEDIQELLGEMVSQGMLLIYGEREPLGQILKWWPHQPMAYARPSKYPAPEGWVDRIRYRKGETWIKAHWECAGGLGPCVCEGMPNDGEGYPKRIPDDTPIHSDKVKEGNVRDSKKKVKKSSPLGDNGPGFLFPSEWQSILIELQNLHDRATVLQNWTKATGIVKVTHTEVVIQVPAHDLMTFERIYKAKLAQAIGVACPDWAEREVILEALGEEATDE